MPMDREHEQLSLLARFGKDEHAATSVEYVLIAVIVAVPLLVSLSAIQAQLSTMLSDVANIFVTALS